MKIRSLLSLTALVAGVAACQKPAPQVAALPLDMGVAQPLGEAPAPGALPPAPPAQIAAPASYGDSYAYPDRAWGMSWAFGDSPPDYAFADEGVTPWVWIADDDSERLAEPVPGGERYYYFEPGAYSPFYVQDPTFGYGFANGALVAIYDRGGRQMAPSADPAAAATAGQYLARGRTLRQEAASQRHGPVAAANWSARRGLIAAQVSNLTRNAETTPGWRAYHDAHAAQVEAHFAGEAASRETWAAQTDARLSEPLRAKREQRLAQSISRGGGAAATPDARQVRAEHKPRTKAAPPARTFARARVERHPAAARSAAAQAREAAYRARAFTATAEGHAPVRATATAHPGAATHGAPAAHAPLPAARATPPDHDDGGAKNRD